MKFEIEFEECQLILLSLALCSLQRPGFEFACRNAARNLGGEKLFEDFMKFNKPPPDADRVATQDHAVLNILSGHTMEQLTPQNVEKIVRELIQAMRTGPCAWAFSASPLKK